jgi:serine/threonine-protein kinase
MSEGASFDGCEVVKKLHAGAVSDLYQAIQEPLGRTVLIKALGRNILPSSPFAASLEREARLLAGLDHPNILKLFDFVKRADRMWLVLEHVDGPALDELIASRTRLPIAAALGIAQRLAEALAHAHARGVVHRDLQPKNVLISRRGEVKLYNFALAVDERLPTAPELLDGSSGYAGPLYMSPEQILGEPADPRSDLFSLGVVLYELISGARPFRGPDERSTSLRIRQNAPPPLSQAGASVPGAVERIVARCLEKLPSDRVGSAAELSTALGAALVEHFGTTPEAAIRNLGGGSDRQSSPATSKAREARHTSMTSVALGFALIGFAIFGSAFSLRKAFGSANADRRAAVVTDAPGVEAAELRVVAHPWAHVFVDGKQRETTPFARPIRLSPGTHYVRLEHPNAMPERRTISVTAGEAVLLEVDMKVVAPASSAGRAPAGSASTATSTP